jgi:hypothetical protein
MGTTENVQAWSKTAATNSTADAGINWAEGQDPATVNNSARGMMAALKKYAEDTDGALLAGGSANALTVTTKQVLSSGHLTDGLTLQIEALSDNTSTTVTFAPDGLTAANVKRADGGTLAIGSIRAGMRMFLCYDAGASEWRCPTIPPVSGLGGRAAFSAHKNSSDQAVATIAATKVTFGTETFDVGSYFASSTWTPPAGIVMMTAGVYLTSYDTTDFALSIFKNGSSYRFAEGIGTGRNLTIVEQSNGTDTYEVYVTTSNDASYTINGGSGTFFMGAVL